MYNLGRKRKRFEPLGEEPPLKRRRLNVSHQPGYIYFADLEVLDSGVYDYRLGITSRPLTAEAEEVRRDMERGPFFPHESEVEFHFIAVKSSNYLRDLDYLKYWLLNEHNVRVHNTHLELKNYEPHVRREIANLLTNEMSKIGRAETITTSSSPYRSTIAAGPLPDYSLVEDRRELSRLYYRGERPSFKHKIPRKVRFRYRPY